MARRGHDAAHPELNTHMKCKIDSGDGHHPHAGHARPPRPYLVRTPGHRRPRRPQPARPPAPGGAGGAGRPARGRRTAAVVRDGRAPVRAHRCAQWATRARPPAPPPGQHRVPVRPAALHARGPRGPACPRRPPVRRPLRGVRPRPVAQPVSRRTVRL
ncbi:hypothetical protein SBRY_160025 [Actinacidiphila bryophytorum]|uniref:Uncharacterized protein n=1 Tax=Actinacidiphila bryophytorum TaxID=1436133 RepID=A0A9W4EDH9_9ACTN|nr:hypothetical protein SBRY_160025 [Actinacidiphila bryophytorum]